MAEGCFARRLISPWRLGIIPSVVLTMTAKVTADIADIDGRC